MEESIVRIIEIKEKTNCSWEEALFLYAKEQNIDLSDKGIKDRLTQRGYIRANKLTKIYSRIMQDNSDFFQKVIEAFPLKVNNYTVRYLTKEKKTEIKNLIDRLAEKHQSERDVFELTFIESIKSYYRTVEYPLTLMNYFNNGIYEEQWKETIIKMKEKIDGSKFHSSF